MNLPRVQLERCVPHAGAMLLLDSVTRWNAAEIVCSARAPHAEHPLVRAGEVSALVAIEYGAQAAAVHGFLVEQPAHPRPGMLAKLSSVRLHSSCIPRDLGDLTVSAQLLSRIARGCLYDFDVVCAAVPIASGRLMVAFEPPAPQ